MTKDDLIHAAIVSGLVDEAAVHDAESYDSGATLAKLDAMYAALQPEPSGDPRRTLCDCPGACEQRSGVICQKYLPVNRSENSQ